MRKFWHRWLLVLMLALLLSGCSDELLEPGHAVFDAQQVFQPGQSIGQSFVARFDGLEEVQFYLGAVEHGEGQLVFHLRTDPGSQEDLRTVQVPLELVGEAGFVRFGFEPVAVSRQRYFYSFVEFQGSGVYQAGRTSTLRSYLDGAFYLDHQAQQAQAAFRLGYQPALGVIGFGREALGWARVGLGAILLLVIPGSALLYLIYPGWEEVERIEKWVIAAGFGTAVFPLWLVWLNFLNLENWILGGLDPGVFWRLLFVDAQRQDYLENWLAKVAHSRAAACHAQNPARDVFGVGVNFTF